MLKDHNIFDEGDTNNIGQQRQQQQDVLPRQQQAELQRQVTVPKFIYKSLNRSKDLPATLGSR